MGPGFGNQRWELTFPKENCPGWKPKTGGSRDEPSFNSQGAPRAGPGGVIGVKGIKGTRNGFFQIWGTHFPLGAMGRN